jgi:CheY-like chemotaxis protein
MIVAANRRALQAGSGPRLYAALLAGFYENLLDQGVPDNMAALVKIFDETRPRLYPMKPIAVVVEPDPDLRGLAAALLEETELSVVECTSAEAAVGVLQVQGEHVVFLFADEHLAGVAGGLKLAEVVLREWPHVHVVLTTERIGEAAGQFPPNVAAILKPWRGLDVLLAAERALMAA